MKTIFMAILRRAEVNIGKWLLWPILIWQSKQSDHYNLINPPTNICYKRKLDEIKILEISERVSF